MFKIGDSVKFKKTSLDSGMIDATEEDVFTVLDVAQGHVMLTEMGSWWNTYHFEHVKEKEIMEEKKEEVFSEGTPIPWEVGQEVFCLLCGKGVVSTVSPQAVYVQYPQGVNVYNFEGKPALGSTFRTLFFSEPKIIAEKFPPKKPFVHKLKVGDKIVMTDRVADYITEVVNEDEYYLYYKTEDGVVTFVKKASVKVFKLGEEIKFS